MGGKVRVLTEWQRFKTSTRVGDFDEALALRDGGRLDASIALFRSLADEFPRVAAIWDLMGGVYGETGDWESVAECGERASKLSPRSDLASLGLFHSLMRLQRFEEALEEMRRFRSVGISSDYDSIRREFLERGLVDNEGFPVDLDRFGQFRFYRDH